MWDEDLPKKPEKLTPRKLDGISTEELKEYLVFLDEEKKRTHEQIKLKQAASDAAAAFFKP